MYRVRTAFVHNAYRYGGSEIVDVTRIDMVVDGQSLIYIKDRHGHREVFTAEHFNHFFIHDLKFMEGK